MRGAYLRGVQDWLSDAALLRPDHPAVEAPDGALTYAELDREASRYAGCLADEGVCRGDIVATTLPPSLAFTALLHGAPRTGAALLPLDARSDADRRAEWMRVAGAGLLVARPLEADPVSRQVTGGRDPSAALTVVLTSGTSGEPRPIALSLANHEASAAAAALALGSDPDDRWLCPLPLFHVGGLAVLVRCARSATTAVLHDRFDLDRVATELAGGVTLVSLVPTMLGRLRDAGLEATPGLRAALLGGGPVAPGLIAWARERGIPVRCTYGLTETCSQVAVSEPGERAGAAVRGARLEIAPGGEIFVAGPMVATSAIGGDGWLHTGDSGHIDREGNLHVTGRIKDLIVSGGENVAPAAVEAVLLGHPAVADVGVVGISDAEWGEVVVAAVVERAPAPDAELLDLCRRTLAPHAVPKSVHRLAELPRNPAGKLLRGELADRLDRA